MLLGDIAKVKGGKRLPKTDQLVSYKTNHPYIRIRDMYQTYPLELNDEFEYITDDTHEKIKRYTVEEGDVILAVVGNTIGLVSLIGESLDGANLTENCNKIVDLQLYDNKFLYYFLSSKQGQEEIKKGIIGSSQPKLPIYNIEKFEIPEISLDSQKKIVSVLETIDKKININEKINDNLESQLLLIYKSWFIDLEPFNKILPDDWGSSPLGEKCSCLLGGTPSRNKPEFWNGTIPWINSGKVNSFRIIEPSEYITVLGLEKSATKLLPAKTVVIAITGATLGQVSLLEIDSCANQSVVGILQNEEIPYEFIYPFIKFKINELISHQTGGAQQHINKQNVENIIIQIPSKNVMKKYINTVSPMYELIENICIENQKLLQLRNTLLPKLISGELDISDIEF